MQMAAPIWKRVSMASNFTVMVRSLTALLGGYAAATGLASLAPRLLPIARVEAAAWGMIASFLIYAGFGLWAFHEPRLARVLGVIWGIALLSAVIIILVGPRL